MPEESEKSEQDSPLKEPLKKKGNDIHNPYPNFKVRKIKIWLMLYGTIMGYARISFPLFMRC